MKSNRAWRALWYISSHTSIKVNECSFITDIFSIIVRTFKIIYKFALFLSWKARLCPNSLRHLTKIDLFSEKYRLCIAMQCKETTRCCGSSLMKTTTPPYYSHQSLTGIDRRSPSHDLHFWPIREGFIQL